MMVFLVVVVVLSTRTCLQVWGKDTEYFTALANGTGTMFCTEFESNKLMITRKCTFAFVPGKADISRTPFHTCGQRDKWTETNHNFHTLICNMPKPKHWHTSKASVPLGKRKKNNLKMSFKTPESRSEIWSQILEAFLLTPYL